jgi:hypothetical protein
LKRFCLFLLFLIAVATAFANNPVDALQSTKAFKQVTLTIVVTPSPIAFIPGPSRARLAQAQALIEDPSRGRIQVASIAHFDTPQQSMVIAQATPQGNIPVTFNAKPDPTAQFLHIVPHTTTLLAAYGANTYTCPYEVFATFATTWKVTDWGNNTVANGTGPFPVENFPTTSFLSWDIPSIGNTTMAAFSNSGSPGQNSFTGVAGVTQQNCINLSLTVPANIAAGFYTASIQYNLIAN